jgi:hypothetical protein
MMNYGKYWLFVSHICPIPPILANCYLSIPCSEQAKGRRLGYMGHLTFISDEVIKVLASYPEDVYAVVKDSLDLDAWDGYINGPLRETKLRDRVPLGGIKPAGGLDSLEHDMIADDINRQIGGVKEDFEEDEEEDEEDGVGGWIR